MARASLGIRRRLAKLLAAAVQSLEASSPEGRAQSFAWQRVERAYQSARDKYEKHVSETYFPALKQFEAELASMTHGVGGGAAAKVRAMLFQKHRIQDIEVQGDELASACHNQLHELLAMPSPTLSDLARKLALILDNLVDAEPFSGAIAAVAHDALEMSQRRSF